MWLGNGHTTVNEIFIGLKCAYFLDQAVLEGVRWSEALDLIFKSNYEKDPTLTWQYFASPVGFMRHYPGMYKSLIKFLLQHLLF